MEKDKKMEEKLYKLEEVKEAFRKAFENVGEVYFWEDEDFPDCGIESYWQDILDELKN